MGPRSEVPPGPIGLGTANNGMSGIVARVWVNGLPEFTYEACR
jgi:hypothetical protein